MPVSAKRFSKGNENSKKDKDKSANIKKISEY